MYISDAWCSVSVRLSLNLQPGRGKFVCSSNSHGAPGFGNDVALKWGLSEFAVNEKEKMIMTLALI